MKDIYKQKVWIYEKGRFRYFILEMDDGYRWALYKGKEYKLIRGAKSKPDQLIRLLPIKQLYSQLKLRVIPNSIR